MKELFTLYIIEDSYLQTFSHSLQSHVTITSVKTFHCQLLHFFEFYDLIFFDGYSVYQ